MTRWRRVGADRALRLGLGLVFALTAVACGRGDETGPGPAPELIETPSPGGTLIVALSGDVDSWNPYTSQDATSAGVLDMLYPHLVVETGLARGEGEAFRPWLARTWEFSADRLTLTLELQPEAVWSDGSPVTCDDVAFTYRAQVSEALAWPGAFIKTRIEGVTCPAPHTVVFRFKETYANQLLDVNDNAIVPAAYGNVPFEAWAATAWHDRIVTAGPFRLASARSGQEAILERDTSWWGQDAYVDRVILRVYPDATVAMSRFLEGEVDVIPKVLPLRAETVRRREDLRLVELPSLSYTFIGWNVLDPRAYLDDRRTRCPSADPCTDDEDDILRLQLERPHPILSNPHVRKALTRAVDREDIVSGIWGGHATVGVSPIVSALWAYDPRARVGFDAALAAKMLDAVGWTDGDGDGVRDRDGTRLEINAIVNADNTLRRDAIERVAANLRNIGVVLKTEPLPRREFVTRARDKNFDAVVSGWWEGTRVQPQNHLHTRAAINRGNNLGSWSTPESDLLLERAERARSREEALEMWQLWQHIFRDQQPLTILYEERRLLGLNARVRGPRPSYLNPLGSLHEWWLAERRRNRP